MKKIILLSLTFVVLTACSEDNNDKSPSKTGLNSSIQCDKILLEAVKDSIENTKNLQIKWSDEDGLSCGVSFKNKQIDFQVDLEFDEVGTAHNMKKVGMSEMTNAELDFKVINSHKNKEAIANLGDKAVYYSRGNSHQVYVLSGDNSFTVKTINWKTRGGDKDISVKVAKKIVSKL